MSGLTDLDEPDDFSEFVEVDPTGRYGRYDEILGKGASKTVYRAFDEYRGIEVAWNQVKISDFLRSPEDLERLYSEIHLLKTLNHKNIMKFHTSWVDTTKRNINFVTEMFTSGTLRQYRLKHKRVNIRAMKHWCRQILQGLHYLHTLDPPVIHRDLKCDNIFVNGNQGEVKIGDLGLAAILRKSFAAHCVGTPEFMAPEVYQEEYNQLVDIYSFGMCVLEMITFEYPYSECNHPAQIYKKVTSGKKPDALYKVKDPELREFIEKCLADAPARLSARELLNDPFLQVNDCGSGFVSTELNGDLVCMCPPTREPLLDCHTSVFSCANLFSGENGLQYYDGWEHHHLEDSTNAIQLFASHDDDDDDDDHHPEVDISIKGKRKEDGVIYLRIRITGSDGQIRNIYFPFDVEADTALTVATEMIAELDIIDQDVTRIAEMIDGEIVSLVPNWKPGWRIEEETPCFSNMKFCQNCASSDTSVGSLLEFISNNPGAHNLQIVECCDGCACLHGRFERITWQVHESKYQETEIAPAALSAEGHHLKSWDDPESHEPSSSGSGVCDLDNEHYRSGQSSSSKQENRDNENEPKAGRDDSSGKKWEMSLNLSSLHPCQGEDVLDDFATSASQGGDRNGVLFKSASDFHSSFLQSVERGSPSLGTLRVQNHGPMKGCPATAKSFYSGSPLPCTLSRSTSLPIDAA